MSIEALNGNPSLTSLVQTAPAALPKVENEAAELVPDNEAAEAAPKSNLKSYQGAAVNVLA